MGDGALGEATKIQRAFLRRGRAGSLIALPLVLLLGACTIPVETGETRQRVMILGFGIVTVERDAPDRNDTAVETTAVGVTTSSWPEPTVSAGYSRSRVFLVPGGAAVTIPDSENR